MTERSVLKQLFTLTIFASLFAAPVQAQSNDALKSGDQFTYRPGLVKKNAPLWVKYLAAGDTAHRKNDDAKARQYWLASFNELDKSGTSGGGIINFPRLEHRLLDMYPKDWSKEKLDDSQRLKKQEEQVSVYKRLANMTRQHQMTTGASRAFSNMADVAYKKAEADLEKTKADIQASTSNK